MLLQRKINLFIWLLALNVLAVAFFGGRYWQQAIKQRQEEHSKTLVAADMLVRMGAMDTTDATRLMDLAADLEHGSKMSDVDLDWCLGKLEGQEPSPESALSRREFVDITFSEAVNVLEPPQKEKLFQALVAEIAMDNSKEELGIDIIGPARILGDMGDKRAIPTLEAHLNDPRPMVHQTVQESLDSLERKAVR